MQMHTGLTFNHIWDTTINIVLAEKKKKKTNKHTKKNKNLFFV